MQLEPRKPGAEDYDSDRRGKANGTLHLEEFDSKYAFARNELVPISIG
jgi:hypothetical protein